jgi:uncharacterized protein (UPF0333 family)
MTTDTKTVHHHSGGNLKSFLAGVVLTAVVALGATAYNTNDKFHSSTDHMVAQASNAISDAAQTIKQKAAK